MSIIQRRRTRKNKTRWRNKGEKRVKLEGSTVGRAVEGYERKQGIKNVYKREWIDVLKEFCCKNMYSLLEYKTTQILQDAAGWYAIKNQPTNQPDAAFTDLQGTWLTTFVMKNTSPILSILKWIFPLISIFSLIDRDTWICQRTSAKS